MKFHYYRWQRVQNIVCLPPIMMQFQKLKHYVILKCYIFFSIFQVDCPFIVCMTYAFHTPDKLCFILDLMNGEYLIIFWLEYFIVYRWDSNSHGESEIVRIIEQKVPYLSADVRRPQAGKFLST